MRGRLGTKESNRCSVIIAAYLAIILMIIRVDLGWWGEEMPMVLFGWLNLPMLYQFGMWVVGYLLVLYTVKYIWVDDQ